MTTIAQLPAASAVGVGDLVPVSQAGLVYSVSIGQLTGGLQPVISLAAGALLGRVSIGAGEPEAVAIGAGLALASGMLEANGADHAGFPVQAALALDDDLVINGIAGPGLLKATALRGLFSAGNGIAIDGDGVIAVTAGSIAGPAGPQGQAGPQGPAGVAGPAGPAGLGLTAPAVGNSVSAVGATDYVPLWQNGALAWIPYGQLVAGQTIDQLPAAAPAADGDELLVAQGGNALSVQSFGSIWSYVRGKLPGVLAGVVELAGNTVLDSTVHNNKLLVASAPLTLSANFENMGSGFNCTLINLSAGTVTMGTGISSGSGGVMLPPGAQTSLLGISYSGGSLVWWSGIIPNAPTITVGAITPLVANTAFIVSGGIFNDAPLALDYSIDGGATWNAAASPVISSNAYSFTMPGLVAGTYTIRVRDHGNVAIIGVSNSFSVQAPMIALNNVPAVVAVSSAFNVTGNVLPAGSAVQAGISSSATVAPVSWVDAVVNGGSWSTGLTAGAVGTYYVWARQTGNVSVEAVSAAVSAVAASLSIAAPASGVAGTALTVNGNVTPVGDAMNIQLSTSNSIAPVSGWIAAVNNSGSYTGSLTPVAAGTYYAWAQDVASGLAQVSAAIIVSAGAAVTYGFVDPGGSYTHGSGSITLIGTISPAQNVDTEVALSTSNLVAPASGWVAATVQNYNENWGVYYSTPAVAGNYYVWAQTSAGADEAVSSFTISVT